MGLRLICSDLDGTLLDYSVNKLSVEILDQIRELKELGVVFAPASGRLITSMKKLFSEVSDNCYFICSNGAAICDGEGKIIDKTAFDIKKAEEIARDFYDRTDGGGEVNFSGTSKCFLWSRGLGMEDRIRFVGNQYKLIKDLDEIDEDIVKVSAFIKDGSEKYIDRFKDKWKEYNAAIAGEFWIDTTIANKGTGVKRLCDILGISLDSVMAFGDNYNDVPMLNVVGQPYVVNSAARELRQMFSNHTDRPEDVIAKVIRELRDGREV